LIYVASSLFKE